jgi:hypothetical protein
MTRLIVVLALALVLAPAMALVLGNREGEGLFSGRPRPIAVPAEVSSARPAPTPAAPASAPRFTRPEEEAVFEESARRAWRYVEGQTQAATGLPNSVIGYPYATIWDVASGLAAIYSARELGIIDEADYDARMGLALRTLGRLRLFDGAAFNKNYQVARGAPAGRNDRDLPARADGFGWSVVDLGRLLVWLKIVERSDPDHARQAAAIANRLDYDRLISGGYLRGSSVGSGGRLRSYQEGRIGYEQYAAAGLALWDHRAERALNWRANVQEVEVLGIPLLADKRPDAFLTGEPFFLIGMELGWWDPQWKGQAERVVAAQEARYDRTQKLTMASEDALPLAPYFFYYYTLYDAGEAFAVRTIGGGVPRPEPRWVSAKAAFAWYALSPDPYTWQVVQAVAQRASSPEIGWSSGFYEVSGKPTGSQNINTAAVILEAALYRERGEPLVVAAGRGR